MASIHVELLEFKHEIAVTRMSTKVIIGSEKLSQIVKLIWKISLTMRTEFAH